MAASDTKLITLTNLATFKSKLDLTYQPLDSDLSAIAALEATSGWLQKTAANTWALKSSSQLWDAICTAAGYTPHEGTITGVKVNNDNSTLVSSGVVNLTIPYNDSDLTNNKYVAYTENQGLTTTQQGHARANIGAGRVDEVTASVGTNSHLTVAITNNSATASSITTSGDIEIGVVSGYSIPSTTDQEAWTAKQAALVSGTNIKTINNNSVLGSGNISVQPVLVSGTNIKAIKVGSASAVSLLGEGNVSLGAAAGKGVATSVSSSSTDDDLPTAKAVWTALNNADPMSFKGTVGTDGTITWANLPTAGASNKGHTYKVITAHTADSKCPAAAVGDTIVSNGSAWTVLPSGDEPSGTVTNIALSMPTGFSVSGSPITSSGTFAVTFASGYSLPLTSKQTAWDAKQDALASQTAYSAKGTTTKVPQITTNSLGQVTLIEEKNIAFPTDYIPVSGSAAVSKTFNTTSTDPTKADRLNLEAKLRVTALHTGQIDFYKSSSSDTYNMQIKNSGNQIQFIKNQSSPVTVSLPVSSSGTVALLSDITLTQLGYSIASTSEIEALFATA